MKLKVGIVHVQQMFTGVHVFFSPIDIIIVMEEPERYEPQPRWGHVSVTIGDKLYMWGGRIENFSGSSKKEVSACVLVF